MSCKIYLEPCGGVYGPGSVVKGQVECVFKNDATFRSIKIYLKCKERVEWKTQKSGYSEKNQIFCKEENLVDPENSTDTCELQPGTYSYPFTFVLPYHIPSTYKGPHGYIKYTLKAVVDIPLWKDYTDKLILIVHAPLIYNISSHNFPSKAAYTNDKSVYLCCFNRGTLSMDVEVPTTTFVCGETINCQVYVKNLTRQTVDDLKIKLVQILTHGKLNSSFQKVTEEAVVALLEDGVGAHGEKTYNLLLKIPERFEAVNFTGSKLMKVEYNLEVCCQLFFGLSKLMIIVPDIQIGHSKCDANKVPGAIFAVNPRSYEIVVPPI